MYTRAGQLDGLAVERAASLPEDVVVSVQNVSKKFCKHLRRSMAYGIMDLGRNLAGMPADSSSLRKAEFWAVRDVSFELRRGECLGVIGPNGSGKTTLLRLIAGIFPPDRGEIAIRGRVGALIALGAGFHPHMTGRENIYLNGTILGMSRRELDRKFDRIVEFAEIGDFLDAPVNSYSAGMRVRLGFAIAVHTEPDVLLVDEVLAVGDVEFKAKCYERIADLLERCAVVFVSHHMPAVTRVCPRVIVLDHGRVSFKGETAAGIEAYFEVLGDRGLASKILGSGEARVNELRLLDARRQETSRVRYGEPLTIAFDVRVAERYDPYVVSIGFLARDGDYVAQCHSGYNSVTLRNDGSCQHIEVHIPKVLLNPGSYALSVLIFDETNTRTLLWHHCAKRFRVAGEFHGSAPLEFQADWEVGRAK